MMPVAVRAVPHPRPYLTPASAIGCGLTFDSAARYGRMGVFRWQKTGSRCDWWWVHSPATQRQLRLWIAPFWLLTTDYRLLVRSADGTTGTGAGRGDRGGGVGLR